MTIHVNVSCFSALLNFAAQVVQVSRAGYPVRINHQECWGLSHYGLVEDVFRWKDVARTSSRNCEKIGPSVGRCFKCRLMINTITYPYVSICIHTIKVHPTDLFAFLKQIPSTSLMTTDPQSAPHGSLCVSKTDCFYLLNDHRSTKCTPRISLRF